MFNQKTLKRVAQVAGCVACFGAMSTPAHAINWLMLQGVEGKKAPDHRLFAFVQPAFTSTKGDPLQGIRGPLANANNGQQVAANTITPNFNKTNELYLRRARLGARGRFTGPLKNSFTSKINYFGLLALDDGLFNQPQFSRDRRPVSLDHASLTFNHIPGARIRAGLFKNPITEEVFQAVATIDFIEFTSFNATAALENFYSGTANVVGSPGTGTSAGSGQRSAYGFSAARDWGVQVFDSFKRGKWDLSYAVKVGRGEATHRGSDSDNNEELYLYASAEYDLPGGRGPRKNGVKVYGWHQSGEREFYNDTNEEEFDRERFGIGVKGLGKFFGSKYKQRFGAELEFAEGMIFLGPIGGVAGNGDVAIATDDDNKSRAISLEYGLYIGKWQFDARWAREQRLYESAANINDGNEREIDATTLGVTYHFTKKARLTFNYVFQDVEQTDDYELLPGLNQNQVNTINNNVGIATDSVGDRIGLQLTYIF